MTELISRSMLALWALYAVQGFLAGGGLLISAPVYRSPRFSLACAGTLGPLLTCAFSGGGIIVAAVLAVAISGLTGLLLWYAIESRIDAKQTHDIYRPIVLSIGIWIVFDSGVTFLTGSSARVIEVAATRASSNSGAIVSICGGIVLTALMSTGPMRRLWYAAWNPALAEIFGIRLRRRESFFVFASHVMMACAGIVGASGAAFTPRHGLFLFFTGMTVYAIGGPSSWLGCGVSACFLAAVRIVIGLRFGGQWVDGATFAILIGLCAWRPLGFSGWYFRKVEV